jgi:PDZ domain-containing secreted protein
MENSEDGVVGVVGAMDDAVVGAMDVGVDMLRAASEASEVRSGCE